MSMTLIEFYDKSPLENIVSSLAIKPKKVVFLGSNTKLMEREMKRYQNLLKRKEITAEMECRYIEKNDLEQIQETLYKVVDENPRCVIDLTGGDGLSLVAVGTVAHTLKDKNISFHRVNLNTRKTMEFFGTEPEHDVFDPVLSVEEHIILYGGFVSDGNEWDWNDEFEADVNKMWEVVRADCRAWNAQLKLLEGSIKLDTLKVQKSSKSWDETLFYRLARANVISNLEFTGATLSFNIKNRQIGMVLSKIGTILELKTYLISKTLYTDAMTGVCIDWDGIGTENEIDVLCMKGLIPVFISCKNGSVDGAELYKLNTVAQRFGGDYAKKALVATHFDKCQGGMQYFRQRAKDMNIQLIENVFELDDKEFARKLKGIM
jgi:Domain of unknown function (DUF1887).